MARFGVRLIGLEFMAKLFQSFGKQQWYEIIGSDLPYTVYGRFGTADGRRVCTALLFGDLKPEGAVVSSHLRKVPLTQIVTAANRPSSPAHLLLGVGPKSAGSYKPQHPGPAGHDTAHYEKVLELLEVARHKAPDQPIQWLAVKLGCSPSTIHRWKDEAAQRGLNGPKESA